MLSTVSERVWREQVLSWGQQHGWRCYFTWKSINSPSGFPDLVMLRPPRVIFAELKTERGRTSAAQDEWLEGLLQVPWPVETYLWRPHDEQLVVEVLK